MQLLPNKRSIREAVKQRGAKTQAAAQLHPTTTRLVSSTNNDTKRESVTDGRAIYMQGGQDNQFGASLNEQ